MRSNSRISGTTLLLAQANTSGASSAMISSASSSCAGFTNEFRKQTATASTPRSRSTPIASRTSSVFSGVTVRPR